MNGESHSPKAHNEIHDKETHGSKSSSDKNNDTKKEKTPYAELSNTN